MEFRIKEARIAANLTQDQLANLLGIKNTTLSGYETGAHDPKSNTLIEIARICGTTVDYLLGISVELAKEEENEVPASLAADEDELVTIYRDLNDHGQTILLNTARGLSANPDMKRGSASNTATA